MANASAAATIFFREIPCIRVSASAASVFFRVSASAFSVRLRVLPWQMPSLVLPSILPSVRFRVIPWLVFILFCPFLAPTKPPKLSSFLVGHLIISSGGKIVENFTKIMIGTFATLFLNSILQSNFS